LTISIHDWELLRNAGFLEQEIQEIANAVTPDGNPQPPIDITGASWRAMMESRSKWIGERMLDGWDERQIRDNILAYYAKDARRNPFDFLKLEYRPPKRINYFEALRNRKERQIARTMGQYV